MSRTSQTFGIVAVVAVLVVPVVAGAGVAVVGAQENATTTATPTETPTATPTATATETPTATPEPSSDGGDGNDDGGWTLEELRQDGQIPSNAPESVRKSGEEILWLVHWPARAMWADVGNPTDGEWDYVGEDGKAVTDNAVYARSIVTDGPREYTFRVVSYRVEDVEVDAGDDGTRTERQPVDVVERSVDVTLNDGWGIAKVPLPDEEEDREVTIIVEGAEEELRWTFDHEPVATSQAAPISSEGDYLWRVAKHVFLPTLGGLFVAGVGGRRMIEEAHDGPGWGLTQWGVALGLAGFLGYVFGPVEDVADLLVAAPILLSVILVTVAAIVVLESYQSGVKDVLFVKPSIAPVTSPSGATNVDALVAEADNERVVETDDGHTAVVRSGMLPFLSRVFGSAAKVTGADLMQTSVELEGSDYDQMVFVKPDEDDLDLSERDLEAYDDLEAPEDLEDFEDTDGAINYDPEGWRANSPEVESVGDAVRVLGIVAGIGAAGFGVATAFGAWFGIGVGAAAAAVWLAEPVDGRAYWEPAPGHLRSAIVSAMVMSAEISDAETLEEARTKNIKLTAEGERNIEEALATQDATLTEALLRGDADDNLDRSIVDISETDAGDATGAGGESDASTANGAETAADGGSES